MAEDNLGQQFRDTAGAGVIGESTHGATRGADDVLEAFRVAAEPEEIVRRAAWPIGGGAFDRWLNRRNGLDEDRFVVRYVEDSNILARTAKRNRGRAKAIVPQHAGGQKKTDHSTTESRHYPSSALATE